MLFFYESNRAQWRAVRTLTTHKLRREGGGNKTKKLLNPRWEREKSLKFSSYGKEGGRGGSLQERKRSKKKKKRLGRNDNNNRWLRAGLNKLQKKWENLLRLVVELD